MDLVTCEHSLATVEDTDLIWSTDGAKVIGRREYVVCPDCPWEAWVPR